MFEIKNKILYITLSFFIVYGCGIYSFTGASYGNAKTVTIHLFENKASIVNPDLAPMLTEKLQDKFINESPLNLLDNDGDLEFQGKIIKYEIKPGQIQAGETAASNRLTITVKVKFTNKLESQNNYEKTFSWYEDFDANENLSDVEQDLIDKITDKLVEDIFNEAVVKW